MKKVKREDLLNYWLGKFHNTNAVEVVANHPDKVDSPDWFKLYPVTQEQYEDFEEWAIQHIMEVTKMSRTFTIKTMQYAMLDCAPYVKREEDNGNS